MLRLVFASGGLITLWMPSVVMVILVETLSKLWENLVFVEPPVANQPLFDLNGNKDHS